MALAPVENGNLGPEVRAKINAVIDAFGVVDADILTDMQASEAATTAAAAPIASALAALQLTAGDYPDTVFAWESAIGQLAMRIIEASGKTELFGLLDQNGKDIFAALTAAEADVAAVQSVTSLLPPAQRLRLKRSLYNSGGLVRQVSASDPLTYAGSTTTTATLPVTIGLSDSRIRLLGGTWYTGTGSYPNTNFKYCQPRSNGDLTVISGSTGLPQYRDASVQAIEFSLPAGQTEFEVLFRDQGTAGQVYVDVDGVGTNAGGYTWGTSGDTFQWRKFTLDSSASARVIRILSPYRPFGGLAVQTGGTIGAAPVPEAASSAVFIGDSITAGSIASTNIECFAAILARRLGVDNYINTAVGGSGYLARFPYTSVTVNTTSGSTSLAVTSGTLTTGAFVTGAGIPQDATVTSGATAGGTATISAAATATATGVSVRNETGRNMFDTLRLNDVLQAVNGGPPDMVFVGAGINDRGVASEGFWTDDQLEAQALRYFRALRAGAPDMVIFVLGSMTNYANPGTPTTPANATAAIFRAAAQVSRVVTIDTANIVTTENRDAMYDEGVDVTHPNSFGHSVVADFIWPTIRNTVEAF